MQDNNAGNTAGNSIQTNGASTVSSSGNSSQTRIEQRQPDPKAGDAQPGADLMLPAFIIAVAALNLAVLMLFGRFVSGLNLRGALVEKDPAVIEATASAVVESRKAAAETALAMARTQATAGQIPTPPTDPAPLTPRDVTDALPASYSRVAGAFGAIVLAGTLYAMANYLVWAAVYRPAGIADVIDPMVKFFAAGAALFAPYAVNELTSMFKPSPQKPS